MKTQLSKMKLTKRLVDALEPQAAPYEVQDTVLSNFSVRVATNGLKTFRIYYRTKSGQRRRPSLGEYNAATFSVEMARDLAEKLMAQVKLGGDPSAEKQEGRKAETVEQLAEAFLKAPKRGKRGKSERKPKTVVEYRRQLKLHILPAWGKKKVGSIRRVDVERLHERLSSERKVVFKRSDTSKEHTRVVGGKGGANRVLALVKAMFGYAEEREIIPVGSSPARHVALHEEQPVKRYLTADELKRLGEALAIAEAEGHTSPYALAAIRLLIFTGCRRDEILTLQWDYIDAKAGRLRLPDSKTGEKCITLNRPAADILAKLAEIRTAGSPWVIQGNKLDGKRSPNPHGRLKNLQAPWDRVRRRAGLADLRIHDLRHLFGGTGAALGLGLTMVGGLLGHKRAETTLRYSDLAPDPLSEAAERIGDFLEEALEKGKAEVVEIGRGAEQVKKQAKGGEKTAG